MGKVREIAPYIFVGSLVAWVLLYSCLSVHYTSNIAYYHHKLSADLRKIRREYAHKFRNDDGLEDNEEMIEQNRFTDLLSKLPNNNTIN